MQTEILLCEFPNRVGNDIARRVINIADIADDGFKRGLFVQCTGTNHDLTVVRAADDDTLLFEAGVEFRAKQETTIVSRIGINAL